MKNHRNQSLSEKVSDGSKKQLQGEVQLGISKLVSQKHLFRLPVGPTHTCRVTASHRQPHLPK